MYRCIDSSNNIYTVKEYCLLKNNSNEPKRIFCPFCQNKLYLRGKNSLYKTHFMHCNNTSCSNVDYDKLFKSKGKEKTKEEILILKLNIISFSYQIFRKIKECFIPDLTTYLYLENMKKINKSKVLKLKNTTPTLIPYIWINELGNYNDKSFLFTNRYNLKTDKIWNYSSQKNIILCIQQLKNNKFKRYVIPLDYNFLYDYDTKIPIEFITSIVPKIFDIFSLDEFSVEFILKDLLSHV